jgi:hypothetical protein
VRGGGTEQVVAAFAEGKDFDVFVGGVNKPVFLNAYPLVEGFFGDPVAVDRRGQDNLNRQRGDTFGAVFGDDVQLVLGYENQVGLGRVFIVKQYFDWA